MSSHSNRQGVNPLRPYYVPPTIGEPTAEPGHIPGPNAFSRPADGAASAKYASKARDIFSDLDYKDYIAEPSPTVVGSVKDVVNELMWKYTSVFLAQPFEAAKLILQVRTQDDVGALGTTPSLAPSPAVSRHSSFKTSSHVDVRIANALYCMDRQLTDAHRSPSPTQKETSPHISHPTFRTPHLLSDRGEDALQPHRQKHQSPPRSHNYPTTCWICDVPTPSPKSFHNYGIKRGRGVSARARMRLSSTKCCSLYWKTGLEAY